MSQMLAGCAALTKLPQQLGGRIVPALVHIMSTEGILSDCRASHKLSTLRDHVENHVVLLPVPSPPTHTWSDKPDAV